MNRHLDVTRDNVGRRKVNDEKSISLLRGSLCAKRDSYPCSRRQSRDVTVTSDSTLQVMLRDLRIVIDFL